MQHFLHSYFVALHPQTSFYNNIFFLSFFPHVLKMINDSFYESDDDYYHLNLTEYNEDSLNVSANATVLSVDASGYEINWFEWATEGVLILIIGILGLLGNCISIWSFSRQKVHRIFHNLLLILAIFDIVSKSGDIKKIWFICKDFLSNVNGIGTVKLGYKCQGI